MNDKLSDRAAVEKLFQGGRIMAQALKRICPAFAISVLLVTYLFLAGGAAPVAAEEMVYEHYYYCCTTDRVAGATWKGQTFVAESSHTARIIRVRLTKEGNPAGNMTVSLRATNASGAPTGGDLASGSIPCSSITNMNVWYDFDLGTDYALSAGTTYAFVMSAPFADTVDTIWSNAVIDSPHDYAGGKAWASYSSGSSWGALTDEDIVFKIVGPGSPDTVPATDPKVLSYLHEYSIRKDPTVLDRIDFSRVDYLVFVAVVVSSSTDPTLRTSFDQAELFSHLDYCVTEGHAAGAKIMIMLHCEWNRGRS